MEVRMGKMGDDGTGDTLPLNLDAYDDWDKLSWTSSVGGKYPTEENDTVDYWANEVYVLGTKVDGGTRSEFHQRLMENHDHRSPILGQKPQDSTYSIHKSLSGVGPRQ